MYKDIAIDEMKRSGVPASITLAQGVLEAQAGNSWLVQNSNNHFGIKCKNNWTGGTVYYDDDARQECFRKYNTAADSYKDHSDFLKNNPRYAFLFQFQQEDYKSWAYGLKQAGYATSKTYPTQLIKIIEDYNLQQYTRVGEGLAANTPSTTKPANTTTTGTTTAAPEAQKPIPTGVFDINGKKVIYVQAGTALIQLANEKNIKLRNLVKYNDLANDDPLKKSNYIFLEKKGKSANNDFHVVKQGETMYDISQKEGIQLRWLRRRNKMKEGEEPAAGQKLALAGFASSKPDLAKAAPVEDPTEGDLNPKQIVDDVKTEMERQQQAAQQQQQQQQQPNKLPAGMEQDLKNIGADVTPAGTTPAKTTTTAPAAPKPAPAKPAATNTTTTPAVPVATTPAVPVATTPAPVYTPPVQTTPAATTPAPPVTTTPAAPVTTAPAAPVEETPANNTPATSSPATTQPGGMPEGTIQVGQLLYHDVATKETLYSIAKRYNVTVEQLRQWNQLENFDIRIGQRLLVGKL
jgi:flagellum-specific peptidoglycan hydrolase FlgJ